jgi:hypothetical protein
MLISDGPSRDCDGVRVLAGLWQAQRMRGAHQCLQPLLALLSLGQYLY